MDAKSVDGRIARALGAVRQAFRGKISRTQSGGGVQRIQLEGLAGETVQDLEHAEQFGFTAHPPAGSDCVVVPLGGKTSHGIIVTTTNGAYRITGLAEGETAVYNQDGAKIVLKQGKIIEIDCSQLVIRAEQGISMSAPAGMEIDAPNVRCTAEITAQGQINGNGGLSIQGGNGAVFTGPVRQTGGSYTTDQDVVASGISLSGHDHTAGVGPPQ
ncbi:phage baseplate assembly protein V [Neisseria sp. HSC-16F19]|nr:phage baseplate assembly protein V [Neisseria sp. HSC-16F19]MCP2041788.1 phage baseplate assembly protein V [Neisseria sp. HSC-16F19]